MITPASRPPRPGLRIACITALATMVIAAPERPAAQGTPAATIVNAAVRADAGEPNDAIESATPIAPAAPVEGYLSSDADIDWYGFALYKGTHLDIQLTVPSGVDYAFELHDLNGLVATAANGGAGVREQLLTTVRPGIYYVKIEGSGTYSDMSPYILRVVASTFNDSFEPNNVHPWAATIGTVPYQSKIYTPSDIDWYRFRMTDAGMVTIELRAPAGADLQLEMYTGTGDVLLAVGSNSAAHSWTINTGLSLRADYLVKVSTVGWYSTTTNYKLAISGPTVANVPFDNVVLGLGPMPQNGGWAAINGGVEASFRRHAWSRLPSSDFRDYNNGGGGVRLAAGDVDGDGVDEFVVGLGVGGNGRAVVVDDESTGYRPIATLQVDWPAYASSNGEVFPAAGDLDGDGSAEIVLGLGDGGAGWYQIFDDWYTNFQSLGWRQVPWPAYTNHGGGATHPAVGDVDGDGITEIIIGLGTGSCGWLQVAGGAGDSFSHRGWIQVKWPAYNAANGTTYPAAGDIDADGRAEIVIGLGQASQGWFAVLDDAAAGFAHRSWERISWTDYNTYSGESHPAVGNVDGDPAAEIVFGLGEYPANGGWFEVRDDQTTGFRPLGWRNVEWPTFTLHGGALFPAIATRR